VDAVGEEMFAAVAMTSASRFRALRGDEARVPIPIAAERPNLWGRPGEEQFLPYRRHQRAGLVHKQDDERAGGRLSETLGRK